LSYISGVPILPIQTKRLKNSRDQNSGIKKIGKEGPQNIMSYCPEFIQYGELQLGILTYVPNM